MLSTGDVRGGGAAGESHRLLPLPDAGYVHVLVRGIRRLHAFMYISASVSLSKMFANFGETLNIIGVRSHAASGQNGV